MRADGSGGGCLKKLIQNFTLDERKNEMNCSNNEITQSNILFILFNQGLKKWNFPTRWKISFVFRGGGRKSLKILNKSFEQKLWAKVSTRISVQNMGMGGERWEWLEGMVGKLLSLTRLCYFTSTSFRRKNVNALFLAISQSTLFQYFR